MRKERKSNTGKEPVVSQGGTKRTTGRSRGFLARILGVVLAATLGVGIGAVVAPNAVKETEVYAKEIGVKNEAQKKGCDKVAIEKKAPDDGYTEVIENAVYSGRNSYSQTGSAVLDNDVTDFANPLPYGNTFIDTNKLNWDTPSNFIIDIRDDRFQWVSINEKPIVEMVDGKETTTGTTPIEPLEDALGNKSTADPMGTGDLKLKLGSGTGHATSVIRGIFYVGPLESYHANITDKPDDDGHTNVIETKDGDPYLYRITYLNAVTLPNGTRGNLVLTMKEVQIETPVTVDEKNPFIQTTPEGEEYSYTKALMIVQKENQLGHDTGYSFTDAHGNPLNQQYSVVMTKEEAATRLTEINSYLPTGKNNKIPSADPNVDESVIPYNENGWDSNDKYIRNAMGNLLDLDIEVVDAEGNPVNGTISYAAHDMDFESVQNVWGRTLGDEFSEGLKIVSGSQSYALVPDYNHKDAITRDTGWLPVGPGEKPLERALSITKEGDGPFADGVRFGSPFIANMRDANGKFDDAIYARGGQLLTYQGDGLTANNNIIVNKYPDAGNNSITYNANSAANGNNDAKKQLYAMLNKAGKLPEGVTSWRDITPEMAWDGLGNYFWKTYRNDGETSFDSGFAVLLDAKKSSLQWSGSRGTGSNLYTTLFDSSIYTYVEPTHGAGGGIYIESYDISKQCATKMVEGSTVMGRNSEVTVTAVPEEGYRVGRILIGDTNYGKDPGERGLQDYKTYTIDGNNIVVDGQIVGTFDGADINVRGHEGLKAGTVELDGFNYDRTGARQTTDADKKIIIWRNSDGTVDVTLPDIDNPMHVHADFDTYYNFYKVWKDDSEPEALTMAAAPAGVYPVSVTIPMPTGEYDEVVDENGGKTFVARMEMVDFEINGSTYHALSGENAGVDFVLSPNNTVEYVEYETDQGTGEVTEKFAIRSNVILMGNEFVHYGLDADGNLVIDARYPVTSDTSVADWDSDDAEEFVINASKYEDKYEGYVTELDKNNTISPGNKVWVVKYPSEGKDFDGDGNLDWPALPVEMLPKDADGNIIDNHEAATHTDRYYWFVTEEVPAWSTESYSNEKAKNPGVIHDPDYYKDSAWVAASLKDADIANELIHEDNEYSYAYMSVFENGGEITNEPSIVIRGKKDWQSDFDNKYETREDIWLHLDVKITNPDGSTIERKDMLPPQMVSATATGAQLAKHWGTKASYSTGDKNVRIVASANKLPGNAKLQAVEGKKVYTGPYKYTRKGTTTYYYINELKEKDADGKIYEYSIRETLDWEGNQPVVKDNIDAGLLGYKSEDVADWTEISANEDTYKYKYTYYNAQTGKNENRTTDMKRYTGTVENKYELIDFTVTKKWSDNKDDADHTADEIKNAVTLYDTDGAVDLDAMGQYTTTVKTDDGEKEEALGTLEVTPETGKEFTLTWKHLPKYIRDASGKIVYAGYYVTENNTFSGYTAPMYTNVDEPGTPDVDESTDDAKAFNTGVIVNAQLININVKKVWDDADNQDGKRADIKVTLFRNGAEYEQVTLTEKDAKTSKTTVDGDTWTWDVWKDLPYADANGIAYNYTAQETEIPKGYDSEQATQQIFLSDFTDEDGDGTEETLTFKPTNKHDPEKISFTITKIWDDADDNDGLRPADGEVTYTIKADNTALTADELAAAKITGGTVDGAAVKAKTTGNDGATVTVENLPRYKKAGEEITYTIEETAVDGYDTVVAGDYTAGFTVTNKHVPEVGSIKVTKIWDDANDQDGKRAATTVTLYQTVDGTTKTTAKVEDATVTLDGGLAKVDGAASNEYTWTDLPVYEAGKKITYSVEEAAVAEYDTTYDENDIGLKKNEISEIKVTNKYTPETTDVTIKKVWDDENDKWGKRPAQADWVKSLTLTDDDEAYDSSKVTPTVTGEQKDNEWTVTWSGLQKNKTKTDAAADVAQIKYDVTEDTSKLPDGYTADPADGKAGDSGTITNKLKLYTITFVDPNPEDPGSPVTITEKKYPKGEQPEDPTDTTDPDKDGTWTEDYPAYEFDGWDETVDPVTGDKTYTAKYVRNIPVEKVWDDNDDQDGKRPDEINVKLLADGQDTDERVKLSDNTNWKGTFTQLPWKTNNNMPDGDIIQYTVAEDSIDGYTAAVSGDAENGFVITNTHDPEKTDVYVEKEWNDSNNQDGIRPDSVVFKLAEVLDGKTKDLGQSAELSESNGWTAVFEGLVKNRDGSPIIYTVIEAMQDALEKIGYEAGEVSGSGTEADPYTITNTRAPEMVIIKATKVWDDQNDKYRIRKDAAFTLVADGNDVAGSGKTIDKDAEGEALTVEWEVPKYAAGEEIQYTVKEGDVSPYSKEITGDMVSGFTITNTYPPKTETTEVTRTITYKYIDENGKEASKTVIQTVTLQRVPTVINKETGEVTWSDWEIVEGETDGVTSPDIEGWTPDRDVDEWTIEYDEDGNPKDAFEEVYYTPEDPVGTPDETYGGKGESQTGTPTIDVTTPTTPDGSENEIVKIELLDKDGNPTDTVEVPEGTYTLNDDGTITFTPKDPEYVGDPTPVDVRGTDKNGGKAETKYTPHVVDNTDTVKRTITYEYSDGTPVLDENGDPLKVEEEVTFTGKVDPKTGEVTYPDDEKEKSFDEVDSPDKDGWTPDQDPVKEDKVHPGDDDIERVVIYNPSDLTATPDETWGLKGEPQTGEPKFEMLTPTASDGTPNEIVSRQLIDPSTGDPTDKPVTIPGQGTYTLNDDGTITFEPEPDFVGNPTPIGVTGTDKNGKTAKTTYTPHVVDPEDTGKAERTIHYTYLTEDGEEVTDDTVQTVTLTRKAEEIDPKTGKVTKWGPWGSGDFPAVDNPDKEAGEGWSTDDVVEAITYTPPADSADDVKEWKLPDEHVVYQPVPEPPTGSDKETWGLQGEPQSGTPEFTEGTGKITKYELTDHDPDDPNKKTIPGEGTYVLDPETGEVTFTPEDGFTGKGTGVTVKATDENGKTAEGKYTPNVPEPETATGKRTITYIYDDGTPVLGDDGKPIVKEQTEEFTRTPKNIDPEGNVLEWNDWEKKEFPEEESPEVGGYTPSRNAVPEDSANPGDDKNELVIYRKPDPTTETEYETVKRTIHYRYIDRDGQVASKDVVQTVTFKRDKTTDPDGKVTYTEWEVLAGDDDFDEVESPEKTGYNADRDKVDPVTVKAEDDDIEEWVIYTPEDPVAEPLVTKDGQFDPKDQDGNTPNTQSVNVKDSFKPGTEKMPDGSDNTFTFALDVPKDENGDPVPGAKVSDDGKKVTVPGEGTYELDEDGNITFTPDPEFTGKTSGVTVKGTDKFGKTAETTYTPIVVPNKETVTIEREIEYTYWDENGNEVTDKKTETITFTRVGDYNPAKDDDPEGYGNDDKNPDENETIDYPAWTPKNSKAPANPEEEGWNPDSTPEDLKGLTPDNAKDFGFEEEKDADGNPTGRTVRKDHVIYTPEPPVGGKKESYGFPGVPQSRPAKDMFEVTTPTTDTGEPNEIVEIKLKGIDPVTGEEVESNGPVNAYGTDPETGERTVVGVYTYDPATGRVTFTPNEKFSAAEADPEPVTLVGTDKNGRSAESFYQPHFRPKYEKKPVERNIDYVYDNGDGTTSPVLDEDGEPLKVTQTVLFQREAVSVDEETGELIWGDWTPETAGMPEVVSPTEDDLEGGTGKKATKLEGWTPDKDAEAVTGLTYESGNPDDVTVVYKRGPVGHDDTSRGPKGQEQNGTPTFDKGTGEIPDKGAYSFPDHDADDPLKKTVPGEGTYVLDPDTGKVTFTPEPDFVGTAKGVTVTVTDENGMTATGKYTPSVYEEDEEVTVTRTIHYRYLTKDGKEASKDVVQTVTFKRESDPATGKLGDWKVISGDPEFVAVASPDIEDHEYDRKKVDAVSVTPDTGDMEEWVIYTPETPDAPKPPEGSDKKTWGLPGETQKGTPQFKEGTGKITKYELTDPDPDDPNRKTVPGEGTYVLDPKTGEVTFTPEDGFTGKGTGVTVKATDENGKTAEGKYVPNVPESETATAKRTITYIYDDGTPVLDENGKPLVKEQTEEFTRTPKKIDPETGEVLEWNPWEKKEFPKEDSPEVDGYTPNRAVVDTDSAEPGDDKSELVIYKKPDPTRETETETVKRTIHYRYLTKDGEVADKDVEQTVTFTREKVTSPEGEVTYTEWQVVAGDKKFAEVTSPVKTGYDVDREKVDAVSVAPETEDMEEWVIYTPTKDPSGEVQPPVGSDKETYGGRGQTQSDTPEFTPGTGKIPEKGAYTLEDPDADNPLKKTVPGEGVYTLDPDTGKVTFEPEPDFVGDGTGVTVKVTDENGLTATGKYTPHVVDNVQKSTATKTVQYYYNNGEPVPEDIAPTQTQEIEFERTGEVDPKTGKITKWNDWTPSEFDKVDSPKVDGFTPNKESVEAEPANPGDNVKDIVIYVPEDEIIEETQTKTITRIIKYRYLTQDGEEAFADVKQTVTFSRIKTTNKTTGDETYTDWIPEAEEMEAVDSPVLDNYNVDRASVDALTIDPDEYENGRVIEEYVIYTPKTIWVTYVDEDGTTIYLEKTTEPKAGKGQKQEEPDAPADPVRLGAKFIGWDRTVDEDGNITYTAKWEPVVAPEETIWVTYIDPDGTVYLEKVTEPKAKDGETQEEPDAPADPAKEGYVFKGWDRTVDEEGNITYIAKWEPEETAEPVEETIWVTYIDPDGTVYLEKVTEPKAKDGETQEEPDAPADPVKEGYVFKGWDRTVDEEGNITYIAKWEPVGTDPADPTTPTDPTDDSKSDGNTPGQSGTQPDPGVDRKTVIDPNTGRQISVVTPSGTKTPGTGDRNNSLIWIIAAVAAAGAGVTAVVIRRRKRED